MFYVNYPVAFRRHPNLLYKLPRRLSATPLQILKGILGLPYDFGIGRLLTFNLTKYYKSIFEAPNFSVL